MEGLIQLILFGGGASIAALFGLFRRRERADAWQRAAQAAGLTGVEIGTVFGFPMRMTGQVGRLRVRMESYQRGRQERGTRIVVSGLGHGAYALTIRAEGFTSALEKSLGEREMELGDEAFDRAAYVQGAPGLVRAVFDADTRRLLRPLL